MFDRRYTSQLSIRFRKWNTAFDIAARIENANFRPSESMRVPWRTGYVTPAPPSRLRCMGDSLGDEIRCSVTKLCCRGGILPKFWVAILQCFPSDWLRGGTK